MISKLKTKISKYKGLLYHLFVFTIFLVFLIIISVLKNKTNIIEPLINVKVTNTNDLEFDLRAFKLRSKINTFIWNNINKKIKKENYLSLYNDVKNFYPYFKWKIINLDLNPNLYLKKIINYDFPAILSYFDNNNFSKDYINLESTIDQIKNTNFDNQIFLINKINSIYYDGVILNFRSINFLISSLLKDSHNLAENNYLRNDLYSYYQTLDNKNKNQLFDALIDLLTHQKPYLKNTKITNKNFIYKNLSDFFKRLAYRSYLNNNYNNWIDIYSSNFKNQKTSYKNYFKNKNNKLIVNFDKEHIIPKSWFDLNKKFNYDINPQNDAHILIPVDRQFNQLHSNYNYGLVKNKPHNSKKISFLGENEKGEIVFEVDDYFKGDIARTFLYFAFQYVANYKNYIKSFKYEKINPFIKQFPFLKTNFLKNIIHWHEIIDRVDQYDIDRNNEIYNYQNNRNPFVDLPNLTKFLFLNNQDKKFIIKRI